VLVPIFLPEHAATVPQTALIAAGGTGADIIVKGHKELGLDGTEEGIGISIIDLAERNAAFALEGHGANYNFIRLNPIKPSQLRTLLKMEHPDLPKKKRILRTKGIGMSKRQEYGYYSMMANHNRKQVERGFQGAIDNAANISDTAIQRNIRCVTVFCGAGGGSGPVIAAAGAALYAHAMRGANTDNDWLRLVVVDPSGYKEDDDMLDIYKGNAAQYYRLMSRWMTYGIGHNDPNPDQAHRLPFLPEWDVPPDFVDEIIIVTGRDESGEKVSFELRNLMLSLAAVRMHHFSQNAQFMREKKVERDENFTASEQQRGRARRFGGEWYCEIGLPREAHELAADAKSCAASQALRAGMEGHTLQRLRFDTGVFGRIERRWRHDLAENMVGPEDPGSLADEFAQDPMATLSNQNYITVNTLGQNIAQVIDGNMAPNSLFGSKVKPYVDAIEEEIKKALAERLKQGALGAFIGEARALSISLERPSAQSPLIQGFDARHQSTADAIRSERDSFLSAQQDAAKAQTEAKPATVRGSLSGVAAQAINARGQAAFGSASSGRAVTRSEELQTVISNAETLASYYVGLQSRLVEFEILSRMQHICAYLKEKILDPVLARAEEVFRILEAFERRRTERFTVVQKEVSDWNEVCGAVQYRLVPKMEWYAEDVTADEIKSMAEAIFLFLPDGNLDSFDDLEHTVRTLISNLIPGNSVTFQKAFRSDPLAKEIVRNMVSKSHVLCQFDPDQMGSNKQVRYSSLFFPDDMAADILKMNLGIASNDEWYQEPLKGLQVIGVHKWAGYTEAAWIQGVEDNENTLVVDLREKGLEEDRYMCERVKKIPLLCAGDIDEVRMDALACLALEPGMMELEEVSSFQYTQGDFSLEPGRMPPNIFGIPICGEWVGAHYDSHTYVSPFRMYGHRKGEDDETMKWEWVFTMRDETGKVREDIPLGPYLNVAIERIAMDHDMAEELARYKKLVVRHYGPWVYEYMSWFVMHAQAWLKGIDIRLKKLASKPSRVIQPADSEAEAAQIFAMMQDELSGETEASSSADVVQSPSGLQVDQKDESKPPQHPADMEDDVDLLKWRKSTMEYILETVEPMSETRWAASLLKTRQFPSQDARIA